MSSTFMFDPDKMDGSGLSTWGRAGEALGNRNVIYMGADGYWYLADADTVATMPVVGLTMEAIVQNLKGEILLQGFIGLSTWTWTTGSLMFASTTPGALTQTQPPGSGDQIQVLGVATSDVMIYFDPSLELVQRA